jgi:ferrochelatase
VSADPGRAGRLGVLVMAHGTPAAAEELEAFYTRIRRGRPPTPEQLAELAARYEAIGGVSPLALRTAAQVGALEAVLSTEFPGRYLVAYGAKHTEPTIEVAAARLVAAGVDRVIGLVLTPHQSSLGSGEYLQRAAAATAPVPFTPIPHWYAAAGFAELLAERITAARADLDDTDRPVAVVFTAHSLPARIVADGDPYPDQLAASAALIAGAAGLSDWRLGWQSAGRTPDPWLGPDLTEVIGDLAVEGFGAVLVCPVGFVSDHLEVLYDLDVEACQVARGANLAFARTVSLNDDPAFIRVLADVVEAVAAPAGAGVAEGGGR